MGDNKNTWTQGVSEGFAKLGCQHPTVKSGAMHVSDHPRVARSTIPGRVKTTCCGLTKHVAYARKPCNINPDIAV